MSKSKTFKNRHIGPNKFETDEMLKTIGVSSIEQLMNETVPDSIRLKDFQFPEAISEGNCLDEIKELASKNQVFKSFIGLGYYDCIMPTVIQRNVLENPGWYTSYTPYQAEISQGRLEALLNFQTMITELTGMELANASLLDEGTAAAEAMTMFHRVNNRQNKFFVSENCFPQTIDILKTRADALGIELIIDSEKNVVFSNEIFGYLLQYPDQNGNVNDYKKFIEQAHSNNGLVAIAADLLSLVILKPPGEFGADVVLGSSQRFGVPMGYGGPHAAYFATHDKYKRQTPGRIIGISKDSHGKPAYRMALQTREQHIRKERATSNICTAQALLANLAGMYAMYHGSEGLKVISEQIHNLAILLEEGLKQLGLNQINEHYFDTLNVEVPNKSLVKIRNDALQSYVNFRYIDDEHIGISLDETTSRTDIQNILSIFARALGKSMGDISLDKINFVKRIPLNLERKSTFLNQSVFKQYHSETKMLRYLKNLENKDISLTISMIPLGSCTMKLNSSTSMMPLSWAEFSSIHPFAPLSQAHGYLDLIKNLENYLGKVTGLPGVSLQPNSGAQGEYAGLLTIRAYLNDKGENHRNVTLIPSSAHGTNPASAVMAGMEVVIVKCDGLGNISLDDLKEKIKQNKDTLAALMVTYPSTHGVFEENIRKVCQLIHDNGGLVYLDGANMNAQIGFTNPAIIGADVCHLNLHKTFSIPHGGGGPGVGPICTTEELKPYLPGHCLIDSVGGDKAISAVSSAPWGSASILLISYAYLRMLGRDGLIDSTQYSILNANYIKSRLEKFYPLLYRGKNGRVAHEMILDLRSFKSSLNIEVEDIAKRLIDFGFHAPTMSWPVAGTIMIEPTESESKDELDRFCDAMIEIFCEIKEIEEGRVDPRNNVLKNSPHTALSLISDEWNHPYSRKKAAYPLPYLTENKYWSSVGRIDNVYGDRNLICTCPSVESYVMAEN